MNIEAPDRVLLIINDLLYCADREAQIYNGYVSIGSLILELINGYYKYGKELKSNEYAMIRDMLMSIEISDKQSVYVVISLIVYQYNYLMLDYGGEEC